MREKIKHCSGRRFNQYVEVKVRGPSANLEILDEVVEDAKTFRILAVLYIDQRADFSGLRS